MDAKVAQPILVPSPSSSTPRAQPRVHASPERRSRSGHDARPGNSTEHATKVVVTGYPSYTQDSDMIRAFTRFGTVNIENLTSKFAILSFASKEEASAACKCTTPLSIYGQYLRVKPFNGRQVFNTRKQGMPRKEFHRNTPKSTAIVEPSKIDFSGDFHQQLDKVMAAIRLTQDNIQAVSSLYVDVETVMQKQWPGCTAVPFGSITTGLGVKSSDADCFMDIPLQYRNGNPNFVQKAKRILQQYPDIFTDILSIPRANTPIVKFFHIPTSINCDLTFKTPLGAQNSKLIAFLLHSDPRLLPMAVLIKYWARVQGFSGSGKLTNYALTMMVIFYLQQSSVGILPSVEWLQRNEANDIIVDYWNTGFANHIEYLAPTKNKQTIPELIGGFFEYYSIFNFDEMVICPLLGMPIRKDIFKDVNQLPTTFERYKKNVENNYVMPLKYSTSICVQDPFELCHNVACAITIRMAADIKANFKFACSIYKREKNNNYLIFLKDLLLQKPKLIRGKTHPDFRINVFPRVILSILNPDWKPVVRDVVFTLFEKMLKIKLGKVEEMLNPDSKKEKEKYTGLLTKQIWKRKQHSKLYNEINLGLQERQELITEEILKCDKQMLNIQFNLILMYCHDPKSSVISIRLGTGDIEAFREFGKFFITDMQNWFMELLKPHAKPQIKNVNVKIGETVKAMDSDIESRVMLSGDETGDST